MDLDTLSQILLIVGILEKLIRIAKSVKEF